MKKILLIIILLFILALGGFFSYKYVFVEPEGSKEILKEYFPEEEKPFLVNSIKKELERIGENLISKAQKFITEKKAKERLLAIEKARRRSENVKGVYMNEYVANSRSRGGIKIREGINELLLETELNALVIDVKESRGPNLPFSLKKLIQGLKEKNVWVIARIVVFRDSSLIDKEPDLYLKTKDGDLWKDSQGSFWLDPQSLKVWQYIIEFSKTVIDSGFDELQFDYIRFPSDGNLEDIVYPFYSEEKEKHKVIREFILNLSQELKSYKPDIILSADLFGLVATQYNAPGVGQRLEDVVRFFDYISFMLYPSHFYGGFEVRKDLKRGLPALYFPYRAEDISQVVSNHPYEVVFRSIISAKDYLSVLGLETKIRPWLQDFSLKADSERGIYYDAEKVKAQIKATEDAGASGFLLWNPACIYTKGTLRK